MQPNLHRALVQLCRRVLHPLVRILLRHGISAGDLKYIVDSVYAHAGSEYLAAQGARVTYSKLAVITGINRSFLPGILASPQAEISPRNIRQAHRASRVLAAWHDDPAFQNRAGRPAVLTTRGRSKSFEQLVRRYSGGVYYRTLLSELLRMGAIKKVGCDRVRALRRSPTARGANTEALYAAASIVGDLLATIESNLAAQPGQSLPICSLIGSIDLDALPRFREQAGNRMGRLIESVDSLLHARRPARRSRSNHGRPPDELVVGVGAFVICREASGRGGD